MKALHTLTGGLFIIFAAMPHPVLASPGYVPAAINLRAGPSTNYPIVARIAATSIVEINGCIRDGSWCDVEWSSRRHRYVEHGWVSRRFLQPAYRNKKGRYAVNPHQSLSVPTVVFDIIPYWDSYYQDQDFYQDRRNYMPRQDNGRHNGWGNNDRDDNRDWNNNDQNSNSRHEWSWGHWNN